MIKRLILSFFALLFLLNIASAQELNCRVSVSHSQVQGVSKEVFDAMQKAIYEFMNNTKWTKNIFAAEERIDCNIFITISKAISVDEFSGSMQIQSTRTAFNSSYNTMMFKMKDNNFHVHFSEFTPMIFNSNSSNSDLVSILAYYAYIILGYDYDSYSLYGGMPYFQMAEKIVNYSQNAREKGWKAYESQKNRYWLIEKLLDKKYKPLHEAIYQYHRLGLDLMSDKVAEGRSNIVTALGLVQKTYREEPGNYPVKLFFDAKSSEIINIFKESFPEEQNRVLTILKEIDPSNASNYDKMRKKM
jgi:hypothetical protein